MISLNSQLKTSFASGVIISPGLVESMYIAQVKGYPLFLRRDHSRAIRKQWLQIQQTDQCISSNGSQRQEYWPEQTIKKLLKNQRNKCSRNRAGANRDLEGGEITVTQTIRSSKGFIKHSRVGDPFRLPQNTLYRVYVI